MLRTARFTSLASWTLVLGLAGGTAQAQIAFEPPATYAASTNPDGVAFGDFGGDGAPEMAVTLDAPDRVEIRTNNGSGSFGAPVSVLVGAGTGPHSIVAVNVDNDADLDLVVTLQGTDQIRVLTNSAGVLTAGPSISVGASEPRYLAAGDLDGNGFVDVVTSNRTSLDVSVLLNSAGGFGAAATYSVGGEPRGVALADVDGDQLLDIVVSNHDDRQVEIFLNLPGSPGVFTPGPVLSVGPQLRPDGVAVADLDGNGHRDVVAGTSGNGLNFASVFFNQGGAVFGGAVNLATGGVNPGSVVLADFDRDGRRDLAVLNQDSNNLSVRRNLGAGSFGAPSLLPVGTNPQSLVGDDVDINGAADLACVNQDSNSVTVYLDDSGTLLADGFESGDTSHWSVVVP